MGWLVNVGDKRVWVSNFGSWVSSMRERERERLYLSPFRFLVFIFYFFNRWCSLLGLVGLGLLE